MQIFLGDGFMTVEDFKNAIEVRRDFDFIYRGKRYVVNVSRKSGEITFGEEYLIPKKFESYRHLMAECLVEGRNLLDLLCDCSFS